MPQCLPFVVRQERCGKALKPRRDHDLSPFYIVNSMAYWGSASSIAAKRHAPPWAGKARGYWWRREIRALLERFPRSMRLAATSSLPLSFPGNKKPSARTRRVFNRSSFEEVFVFGRTGSDLLFRALRLSTIGAGEFYGRVRDGIGYRPPAKTTSPAKNEVKQTVFLINVNP